MKIALMQPYFMPYIGYFQLINSVDLFILCDNMQYTKRGWFNRNRLLNNGKDFPFTIPLSKNNSSYINVDQISLAKNSIKERSKILKQITCFYKNAPFYEQNYPIIRRPFLRDEDNLFRFNYSAIIDLTKSLNIKTDIMICSKLKIDHSLKAQDRIIEACKYLGADTYINSFGGKDLYSEEFFKKNGIELKFIKPKNIKYKQFNHDFVPWLSIIDVLMFNDLKTTKIYLDEYEFD